MTIPIASAFTEAAPVLRKPGDFPEIIDNTMRCDFVACPQQFKRRYIDLLTKADVTSIHLEFGGAYARGLEVTRKLYYGGYLPFEDAMAAGYAAMTTQFGYADTVDPEGVKNYDRLCATFVDYWRKYPPDTDYVRPAIINDEPAVEFSFILPIEEVLHPVTGQPLLYSGRADMLADMNGALFVFDDKTTSSLGSKWASDWELRSQFSGYCWAAIQFGYPVVGAIIRGVGILKTETKHGEAIVYRPRWRIERWYAQLVRDLNRMVTLWKEGYFDYAESDACNAYGGCEYRDLCSTPVPENWVEGYNRLIWDPTSVRRIPVTIEGELIEEEGK